MLIEGTKPHRLMRRLEELKTARQQHEWVWRLICEHVLPYRPVWSVSDVNSGRRRDQKILNSAPVISLRTMGSGMQTGITNATKEWWGLGVEGYDIEDDEEVNIFLEQARRILDSGLGRSNWYWTLGNGTYVDLGAIGNSAMFMEDWQEDNGLLFTGLPIGEYYFDVDHFGRVDTCFREKYLTARQVIQKFGHNPDAISETIRTTYANGNSDQRFMIHHAVLPNDEYEQGQIGPEGYKWASCWWDPADIRDDGHFLHQSGYHDFPVLAPRLNVPAGAAYGYGPGLEVLGDCMELQHYQKCGHKILDKGVNPPLAGHGVSRASMLPGDLTPLASSTSTIKPIYEPNPLWLRELREEKAEIIKRIERGFGSDLWRQMLDDPRSDRMTATEANIQFTDRMNLLGPILGNLDLTLFAPMIRRGLVLYQEAGKLPLAPEILRGAKIKIKFKSMLHQMQQATGLIGIRTLVDEAARLFEFDPEVVDKIDTDLIIDEVGKIAGVRPDITIPSAQAARVRAERKAQQQAQQQGEAMVQATQGAKNLSTVKPQQLQDLASQLSPVAAAQGGAL